MPVNDPHKTSFRAFALRLAALCVLAYSCLRGSAQEGPKPGTLTLQFMLKDFRTGDFIRRDGLNNTLKNGNWSRVRDMDPGLTIQYLKGISRLVDLSLRLDASYTEYLYPNGFSSGASALLVESDAGVNVKLLPDRYWIVPYLTTGVGVSKYTSHFGAYVPLGVGFQVNLGKGDIFLFGNFQYRAAVTENVNDHLAYGIGFGAPLSTWK